MQKPLLSRRTFLKMLSGTVFLGTGSSVYGYYFEPTWIEIMSIQLQLPRLAPEFQGYRIVQISDIHLDKYHMTTQHLAEIISTVNQLRPDLVAITGDFITAAHDGGPQIFVEDLAPPLRLLTPRDAVVAVLGNHDHEQDPATVRQAIQTAEIIDLSNAVYSIRTSSVLS